MTMKELSRDIAGVLEMAKDYKDLTYDDIAKACDISASTIANKKSKKELPLLSFWSVAVIARLAGKKIIFVDERSQT